MVQNMLRNDPCFAHNPMMQQAVEQMANNPEMLKAPIAIINKKAILCKNPTDILKLA